MKKLKSALLLCLCFSVKMHADVSLSAVSWLGGSGDNDRVVGTVIQPDGKIVLAANISDAQSGGVQPALLNGATDTSGGAIVVLSADGKSVVSVTRLAGEIMDMAIDSDDNIYLAAAHDGILKLASGIDAVSWSNSDIYGLRIDVGNDGTVAVLDNAKTLTVLDASGSQLGSKKFGDTEVNDVCVASAQRFVIVLGFNNKHTGRPCPGHNNCPVQVAFIRAFDYACSTMQWEDYNWPGPWLDNEEPDHTYGNHMADTRGYRAFIAGDGNLYCAFETAGGNHMFRRDPKDITKSAPIVGGDFWHNFYNSKSEHKTFFARYEPANGEYLLGQQFHTRYCAQENDCKCGGNTAFVRDGNIYVDDAGCVYLVGASASGLPIPEFSNCKNFTMPEGGFAYNPFDGNVYTGGAYILIMSPGLDKRLYCTRLSGGATRAVAVSAGNNGATTVVWAGNVSKLGTDHTSNPEWLLDTHNPLQPDRAGGEGEGFFAVMNADFGSMAVDMEKNARLSSSGTFIIKRNKLSRQAQLILHDLRLDAQTISVFDHQGRCLSTESVNNGSAAIRLHGETIRSYVIRIGYANGKKQHFRLVQ
ncbi:MAG: hypothetical protein GF398_07895 [Chitinivibrionales bacterium]|nr:hypothetical protein [Chitinivibrionales bacterium]